MSGVCAPLTHQSLLRAELCSCLLGWQPQHPSVLSQAWPRLGCLCPQEIQFCSEATLHLVHQHQRTTKHITYANKLKKLEGLNPLCSPEPPLCAISSLWTGNLSPYPVISVTSSVRDTKSLQDCNMPWQKDTGDMKKVTTAWGPSSSEALLGEHDSLI